MTNNPLLQKYDELYGQKEEPKPSSPPPRYSGDPWAIKKIENLLEDLKSGRAVLVESHVEEHYKHYDARTPLRIDEGVKITLTIFRKYR